MTHSLRSVVAALSMALTFACVPPTVEGWTSPGRPNDQAGRPGAVAVTATAATGPTCVDNYRCYAACAPVTEACMATCDAAAATPVVSASRAVVACVLREGCADEVCIEAKCPTAYAACQALTPTSGAVAADRTSGGGGAPLDDGFTYNTAHFDDGWTATAMTDYVYAEHSNMRLYLYYEMPYEGSTYTGTGLTLHDDVWDRIVARDFATSTKFYPHATTIGERPEYLEGWATDRRSGERRFLMMYVTFVPGTARTVLISAPDEATARQWFPKAADPFASELPGLLRYNRFPIAARDVVGTWSNTDTNMTNWYNADTGAYAGSTIAARSATFTFAADGTYASEHKGATGSVGALNTFQQEYHGAYRTTDWSLVATNRWKGASETFSAYFRVVRGGRLLSLMTNDVSGYLLVRTAR